MPDYWKILNFGRHLQNPLFAGKFRFLPQGDGKIAAY